MVKHKRRYFFREHGGDSSGEGLLDPADMLETIVTSCTKFDMVQTIPSGTQVYRAHLAQGRRFTTPRDYGAPPADSATQSRMSPAGIPMTYVAEDLTTALEETSTDGECAYEVGELELLRPLSVIDLTRIPPVPSIFDVARRSEREQILFLREFVRDLSKPIERDGREHIEYVPTQIVTEYFRSSRALSGKNVVGLRYRSARRDGGTCLVLFGGQELVKEEARGDLDTFRFDNDAPSLKLAGHSQHTLTRPAA